MTHTEGSVWSSDVGNADGARPILAVTSVDRARLGRIDAQRFPVSILQGFLLDCLHEPCKHCMGGEPAD